VGYGDRNGAPTTQGGRLFHTFFVLYGISIVAVALVEIANYFLEKREAMLKEAQVNGTKHLEQVGSSLIVPCIYFA